MCGLAGAFSVTPLIPLELKILYRLSLLTHLRGEDSIGWIARNDKKISFKKKAAHPLDVLPYVFRTISEDVFKDAAKPNMIGFHFRAATKGTISDKNAHPFSFQHILGMHNGTISWGLKHEKEFETDSEALFKEINDAGIEATLKKLSSSAAFALVFIDRREGSLCFVRNDARPLHIAVKGQCLYWASEKRDLINALESSANPQVAPKESSDCFTPADDVVYELPPFVLFSIPLRHKGRLSLKVKKIAHSAITVYSGYAGGSWRRNSLNEAGDSPYGEDYGDYSWNLSPIEVPTQPFTALGEYGKVDDKVPLMHRFFFPEFGRFYAEYDAKRLWAWRLRYPHAAQMLLHQVFSTSSSKENRLLFETSMGVSSRKQLKRIMRIDRLFLEWLKSPRLVDLHQKSVTDLTRLFRKQIEDVDTHYNAHAVPIGFDPLYYVGREAGEERVSEKEEDSNDNVLPFKESCAGCFRVPDKSEDLFILSSKFNEESKPGVSSERFLCEDCQDKMLDPRRVSKGRLFEFMSDADRLKEFVSARITSSESAKLRNLIH